MIGTRGSIRVLVLAIACGASSGGCSVLDSMSWFQEIEPERLTAVELWRELDDFSSAFTDEARRAAEVVRSSTTDRSLQRTALAWKIQAMAECRQAMTQDDPAAALLDLWSLCVQARQSLEVKPPLIDFGTGHESVLAGMRSLETDVRAIADAVLDDAQLTAASAQIEAYAIAHPLGRGFGREITSNDRRAWSGYAALESVLALPLSPFRALQGIDTGAQAIAEFASVADRFSTVVSQVPESLRWQLEMILFGLDDLPVLRSVESLTTAVASSSQRLAAVAEALPADLERNVNAALDRIAESEQRLKPLTADLHATASEANAALASLDRAVAGARELTVGLEGASTRFAEAGRDWGAALAVLRDITGGNAEPKTSEPSNARPFDIREYGQVASELARAAVELRGTLTELDGMLEQQRLEQTTTQVDLAARRATDHAAAATEAVIDLAFHRLLLLVGAIFVAAVVYRLVAGRIAKARPAA